jgi:hypothetical protein
MTRTQLQTMTSIASHHTTISKIVPMLDNPPNIQSIVQQVRLSRMKLGSVLERIEAIEPSPVALEELDIHAENVGLEIDALIDTLDKLMSSKNMNP